MEAIQLDHTKLMQILLSVYLLFVIRDYLEHNNTIRA
jgi:hypothetical protein